MMFRHFHFPLLALLLIPVASLCQTSSMPPSTLKDHSSSLRNLVPANWWQTTAGLKIMTLKPNRENYGEVLSPDPQRASIQLEEISAAGFQAIEIFAPAEGLYAYSGLDTRDFYTIDRKIGTMDDFRRLVRIAHSKGLAVVIFLNVGYFSVEAPDFLEACRDKKANRNSEKAKWFFWADRSDAPPPGPEDNHFLIAGLPPGDPDIRPKTWGWQYSELAGSYYWARWEAKTKDGKAVGLPQTNWGGSEWPKEANRIIRFWMDTGLDGMLIDAPVYYAGMTWEKNDRNITGLIRSYGNTMAQPEGGRDVAWVTEGGYNCMQDYGLRYWGNKWADDWPKNSILNAINTGDTRPIEESLRNYHDIIAAAGGVLYQKVTDYYYKEPEKRHLAMASVAAVGDLVVYLGNYFRTDMVAMPDVEEQWVLRTKALHPALQQLSTRRQLPTNADDRFYAFLRTAADRSERVLVVMNFQKEPQKIQIDMSGVAASSLVELKSGELLPRQATMTLEVPAFGYRFYQVLPVEQ